MKNILVACCALFIGCGVLADGLGGVIQIQNEAKGWTGGWTLKISYPDQYGNQESIYVYPGELVTIPVNNIFKKSITIEYAKEKHDYKCVGLQGCPGAPASNNGLEILSAINANASKLERLDSRLEVTVTIEDGKLVTSSKVEKPGQYAGAAGAQSADLSRSFMEIPGHGESGKLTAVNIDKNPKDAAIGQIPEKYRDNIKKEADKSFVKIMDMKGIKGNSNVNELYYPLFLIAKAYGFEPWIPKVGDSYDSNIYFMNQNVLKGKRNEASDAIKEKLKDINKTNILELYDYARNKEHQASLDYLRPIITSSYKIHLMPKKEKRLEVIIKLLEALSQQNSTLAPLISGIKILPKDAPYNNTSGHTLQNAIIVIYPGEGKKNVQEALNKVYSLFKNSPNAGMNVRPRYNAKVTDLIWIGQGDGQAKEGALAQYFEEPNRVYFKPSAFGLPSNTDFHLKYPPNHPNKGKDIVDIGTQ